jgi:quercetin dioxygenase-like cupin family protein
VSEVQYMRLLADGEGESHCEEVAIGMNPVEFIPGRALVDLSSPFTASTLAFVRVPAGWDGAWHPTPRRQLIVGLAGTLAVTSGDGKTQRVGPGMIVLLEDTIGRGHFTAVSGGDDWHGLVVTTEGNAPSSFTSPAPANHPIADTQRGRYARVYTGTDGTSHFADVAVPLRPVEFVPGRPLVDLSVPYVVGGGAFIRVPAGWESGGHYHPPRRNFFITLHGVLEIGTSDGEHRRLDPGAIWLAEDTSGTGHITRNGGDDWLGLLVTPSA